MPSNDSRKHQEGIWIFESWPGIKNKGPQNSRMGAYNRVIQSLLVMPVQGCPDLILEQDLGCRCLRLPETFPLYWVLLIARFRECGEDYSDLLTLTHGMS